jgi:Na+-transporting methylmalonyl-CoA/oxaloacetate decarboxylase gamma subunit
MGLDVGVALVIGFPVLLLVMIEALGWLEAWMLQPDERAAAVQQLLDQEDEIDRLEHAVAAMLAPVATVPRPQSATHTIRGAAAAGSGVS